MDTTTYVPKANCFAYSYRHKVPACGVLNELVCTSGRCPFYKPKIQAEAERERAYLLARERGYYRDGKYVPRG